LSQALEGATQRGMRIVSVDAALDLIAGAATVAAPKTLHLRRSSGMAEANVLSNIEKVRVGGVDIARLDLMRPPISWCGS
jgi:hypothetical protein